MAIGAAITFLLFGGVILINGGLRYRKGHNKHHFFAPTVRLGSIAWMSFPLGIMCILWAVAMILPTELGWLSIVLLILGLGIAFLGLLFALVQVPFMKPSWLRWLEREHSEIVNVLRQEAKEVGYREWEQRVSTQEGRKVSSIVRQLKPEFSV